MALSIFMFLAALISVSSGEYFRYTFSNKEITINADNCVSQECTDGLRCNQNCTILQACVNNQVCDVRTCLPIGQTQQYCVGDADDNYECGEAPSNNLCYNFQCAHEGYFPDISDLKKYYYCSSANAVPQEYGCKDPEKYDPVVQKCSERPDITYDKVSCGSSSAGPFCGTLTLDPYIYYLCVQESALYNVLLSKCDNGNFDTKSCKCSDANTTPSTPVNKNCQVPYEFYPVDGDCHSYCYCTVNHTCDVRSCSKGSYFNTGINRCIVGDC